jgi:hypothetical protein
MCEIFDLVFFTKINPNWIVDFWDWQPFFLDIFNTVFHAQLHIICRPSDYTLS